MLPTTAYSYTEAIGEFIAGAMLNERKTLRQISNISGMPTYMQLQVWFRDNVHFREQVAIVRQAIGFDVYEELVDSLHHVRDLPKEAIAAHGAWFKQAQYIIEKSDPKTFNAPKATANVAGSIRIILDNGISNAKEVKLSDVIDVQAMDVAVSESAV